MLDNTAFEIAGFEPVGASGGDTEANAARAAVAGCLACHETLGACAFHLAQDGAMSPTTALAVCGAMQRMARRAMSPRTASLPGYLAYVWLGPSRPALHCEAEAEAEALAERIR